MKKAEFTSGDYAYILLEDGTAEITDYDGQADVLEIPAQLDGYTVTSISNEMCYDRSGVCSVTIPDSVIFIGDFAFSFCNSLRTVTIPTSVSSIGERAFS